MAFQDEHAPSIPAKLLLSASILAGTIVAAAKIGGYPDWLIHLVKYEKFDGNIYRQIIMFVCCLIYFLRFTICMFIFLKRKIGWIEGGLVSFLFFMMFYSFGVSAGRHPDPIGVIDMAGILLFLTGSYINTRADYQRFVWKSKTENQNRLYTQGLFKYAMHINYFGDGVAYIGLALITHETVCILISLGIIVNFIFLQIPMLDKHLGKKYGKEFQAYAKRTKSLIPFIF
jgi:protein-S-isoprenylcysteine O-methyltransferase Ste14